MVETPEKSSEIDIAFLIDKLSKKDSGSVPLKNEQKIMLNNSAHEAISNDIQVAGNNASNNSREN
ncbi:MAG: hypothetical protein QSU88_03615, partial [Candidatus Methanoperedens sp.]|nr:hypothetical protein [Candidatus Methanoperedens sp.]